MTKLKSEIKSIKGNIPINENLLNKYSSAEEIFEKEKNYKINIIKNNIKELEFINLNSLNVEEVKKIAFAIFSRYHRNNIFVNNGYKIIVNKSGISESIQKIYYSKNQKNY